MKLQIIIKAEGQYWNGGTTMTITDPMVQVFEPIRTSNDPICCLITGDKLPGSIEIKRKLKLRKEAAAEISNVLTQYLLQEMRKNDTSNGYEIE